MKLKNKKGINFGKELIALGIIILIAALVVFAIRHILKLLGVL